MNFNNGDRVYIKSGPNAGVAGTVEQFHDEYDYPKVRVRLDNGDNGVGLLFYPENVGLLEDKNKALVKMVRKLDARNKRVSQGYVTNRDELIAILSELTPLLSVAILEEERPYSVQHKEISVTVKLGFTLERELL